MFRTKLEDVKGIEEAIVIAGHNFGVDKIPCSYNFNGSLMEYEGNYVTVRNDNGSPLGIVGSRYKVNQPKETWDFIDKFLSVSNGKIDRGLLFDNGRRIGASITLNDREYIRGDRVTHSMLIMNSFDGSTSFMGYGLSSRWVCMNQLPHSVRFFNIKHTTNMDEKIGVAREMLNYYNEGITDFDDKMKYLVGAPMDNSGAIAWFKTLIPKPKEDKSQARYETAISKYNELLVSGKGTEIEGVKGTAYGAMQALTEYVNHHKTIRAKTNELTEEKRFDSTVFGSGNNLMQVGFNSLLQVA